MGQEFKTRALREIQKSGESSIDAASSLRTAIENETKVVESSIAKRQIQADKKIELSSTLRDTISTMSELDQTATKEHAVGRRTLLDNREVLRDEHARFSDMNIFQQMGAALKGEDPSGSHLRNNMVRNKNRTSEMDETEQLRLQTQARTLRFASTINATEESIIEARNSMIDATVRAAQSGTENAQRLLSANTAVIQNLNMGIEAETRAIDLHLRDQTPETLDDWFAAAIKSPDGMLDINGVMLSSGQIQTVMLEKQDALLQHRSFAMTVESGEMKLVQQREQYNIDKMNNISDINKILDMEGIFAWTSIDAETGEEIQHTVKYDMAKLEARKQTLMEKEQKSASFDAGHIDVSRFKIQAQAASTYIAGLNEKLGADNEFMRIGMGKHQMIMEEIAAKFPEGINMTDRQAREYSNRLGTNLASIEKEMEDWIKNFSDDTETQKSVRNWTRNQKTSERTAMKVLAENMISDQTTGIHGVENSAMGNALAQVMFEFAEEHDDYKKPTNSFIDMNETDRNQFMMSITEQMLNADIKNKDKKGIGRLKLFYQQAFDSLAAPMIDKMMFESMGNGFPQKEYTAAMAAGADRAKQLAGTGKYEGISEDQLAPQMTLEFLEGITVMINGKAVNGRKAFMEGLASGPDSQLIQRQKDEGSRTHFGYLMTQIGTADRVGDETRKEFNAFQSMDAKMTQDRQAMAYEFLEGINDPTTRARTVGQMAAVQVGGSPEEIQLVDEALTNYMEAIEGTPESTEIIRLFKSLGKQDATKKAFLDDLSKIWETISDRLTTSQETYASAMTGQGRQIQSGIQVNQLEEGIANTASDLTNR